MTYMIGSVLGVYLLFALIFIVKFSIYLPTYLSGIIKVMINPVKAAAGINLVALTIFAYKINKKLRNKHQTKI